MNTEADNDKTEFDTANLYREETYTDQRLGTIRRLIPVTPEGEPDTSRDTLYRGQAAIMTPAGQLPLHFDLEADSLAGAAAAFGDAVEAEAQRMMEELRDMQRKQELASPVIQTPGGGAPGGGKIQL